MTNLPRPTRTLAALAALALLALPALAERGDDADRKSKNGHTEATIDGVTVSVDYGRPSVRGREIWGSLVAYDKLWRTGADECTTVTFDRTATVEGQPVDAGKYALFTVPGEQRWTIVLNKDADQWGAYDYDSGKDVLRVTVEPQPAEHVEAMEFVVDGKQLVLRWEKVAVPIVIGSDG